MTTPHRQPLPHGFTVVELVVVLAVLLVLAAITFAATAPAREKARQQVCVSNFRQLNMVVVQYRADWDGNDVGETASQCGFPPPGYAILSLRPYVRGDKAWQCPDVSAAELKDRNFPQKDGFWTLYSPGWMFDREFDPTLPTVGSVLRRRGDMFVSWQDDNHDLPVPDRPREAYFAVISRLNGAVLVRNFGMNQSPLDW